MAKGNYISKAAENVQNFIGEKEVKKEKKAGRPSNGETVKISLAVPAELHAGMEAGAALFFKGNKTAYINSLIKKDLEENLETYNKFLAIQKNWYVMKNPLSAGRGFFIFNIIFNILYIKYFKYQKYIILFYI